MVDPISILFGACILCVMCCMVAANEKSNETLETIASKLHAINVNVNDLNTWMKETKRERKRKEAVELEINRNAFMAGIRAE